MHFVHIAFLRAGLPENPAARPFLVTPDGRRDSYADLLARSSAYAGALAALGVRPGDRVAAQVEKSPEALYLFLGALRAGAVFLPLNTAYTEPEVAYFLADAQPALFVCDPARQEALAGAARAAGVSAVRTLDAAGRGSLAEAADAEGAGFADVPRDRDDLAALVYTSGTTGRSKGAMLTHGNLASNALTLRTLWRFEAGDVLLHALPLFHVHGLFVALNTVLAAGASLLFLPRFEAGSVLAQMARASVLMGVPTFYTRLLDEPGLTRDATAHMRLFVSGSAPLLVRTHRAFAERTGHAILERYGMTETGMNASNPYDGPRVPGTVGPPLPDVALRVVDPETGALLGVDAVGMVEVRGPNVFSGYWRMPEKTAAEFRPDGYFVTGDLGRIDARGYLQIVGRGKDLIIAGGYNIYPKEVETAIDALPGIVESAVIGVPHPDLGEAVVALVVTGEGAPDEATIQDRLGARLARYKCPRRVIQVEALPRNAMGKVQKNLLRQAHAGLFVP